MHVVWLKDIGMGDLPQVGGKNASLGEMIRELAQAGAGQARLPARPDRRARFSEP